jgi:hypothetical protein
MRYHLAAMKNAPRSRLFLAVCGIYIVCVLGAFLVGLVAKDDQGVTFIPVALLTLPWVLHFAVRR